MASRLRQFAPSLIEISRQPNGCDVESSHIMPIMSENFKPDPQNRHKNRKKMLRKSRVFRHDRASAILSGCAANEQGQLPGPVEYAVRTAEYHGIPAPPHNDREQRPIESEFWPTFAARRLSRPFPGEFEDTGSLKVRTVTASGLGFILTASGILSRSSTGAVDSLHDRAPLQGDVPYPAEGPDFARTHAMAG